MLSWLRRSRRFVAPFAVVLAAMVVMGTTDWWHVDDDDFAPASIHDHSSHQPVVKASRPAGNPPGEHCFLCHWLRSFQNGLGASSAHEPAGGEARRVHPISISVPRDVAATLLPARAPPV